MTAPASKILDRWLESEPLKATLATDSVIGAMISPNTPGSGYEIVLAIMWKQTSNICFTHHLHLHENYFQVKTKWKQIVHKRVCCRHKNKKNTRIVDKLSNIDILSFFPYRYVLLHHVMAQVAGVRGAWGYPEGGMGGVTQAMARAAEEAGVDIFTNQVII